LGINIEEIKDMIISSLIEHELIKDASEISSFELIEEGLINYVFSIRTNSGNYVAKHAKEKARARPNMNMDVNRLEKEFEAINLFRKYVNENNFPEVLYFDNMNNILVMKEFSDDYRCLGDDLKKGNVDVGFASKLGGFLAEVHNKTLANKEIEDSFDNIEMIKQIKIPWIYDNIVNDKKEIEAIEVLKQELLTKKQCLVLGDFKPNNLFVSKDNFVLVDYEQAYYGDPVLDFMYMPSSYILLSFLNIDKQDIYFDAVKEYWDSYKKESKIKDYESRALKHLGVLMLSRLDGITKYDFLQDSSLLDSLRKVFKDLIFGNIKDINECLEVLKR